MYHLRKWPLLVRGDIRFILSRDNSPVLHLLATPSVTARLCYAYHLRRPAAVFQTTANSRILHCDEDSSSETTNNHRRVYYRCVDISKYRYIDISHLQAQSHHTEFV